MQAHTASDKMETHPLVHSPTMKRDFSYKKRPGTIFSVFMWLLGLIEWSHPVHNYNEVCQDRFLIIDRPAWQRRVLFVTSMTFLIFMTSGSLFTVTWYCICYFGSPDHLLRFTSFTFFYWPIVMSSQVVCITAAIKNLFKQPESEKYTFANVFNEQAFARKWYGRSKYYGKMQRFYEFGALAFFYFLAGVNSFFELHYFVSLDEDCKPWPKYVSLVFRIFGLFFFSTFCFFLFLQRSTLEEQSQHTIWYVRRHCSNLEACFQRVRQFFSDYYQLRQLLLPWLNFVLFSTTFGLAFFFSWNYQEATVGNITTVDDSVAYLYQIEWGSNMNTNLSRLCRVECEIDSSVKNKTLTYMLFNILVFSEKLMVVAFALFVVGGIDLKYMWDRFKLKINMSYTSDDATFWKHLDKFVRHLHPDTMNDTIAAYIIPLIGIVLGLISNGQFGV